MKKNVLNKKILLLIILLMVFPLLSISVYARTYVDKPLEFKDIKVYDSKTKRVKNLPVVDYSSVQTRRKSGVLGQELLEPVYDNRTYINSGYQSTLDICWAFSNKNLLESLLRKKYNTKLNFSARHIDFALSSVVLDSLYREPGTGNVPLYTFPYYSTNQGPVKETNFPFNTSVDPPTLEELNQNIENIYVEGITELPQIHKERVGNNITYKVVTFEKIINNVPESAIKTLRDNVKRYIKEYGSLSAYTSSKNIQVMYSGEEFVYNATGSNDDIDHNVSIIGWHDTFCSDHPDGSTSGVQPINSGAWLVSDSNQPNGDQFYYIAYDDVFIEQMLYGFNDASIGKRFNIYRHDLIGMNGTISPLAKNTEGEPIVQIANVFNKTESGTEYLNKVGFYTLGNVTVDVYYIPTAAVENGKFEKEGTLLKTINIPETAFQYHTIDINQSIQIPVGKFAIELVIKDHRPVGTERKVKIGVEYKAEETMLKNIIYKNKSYIINNESITPITYNFPIRAYTSNQPLQTNTFLVSYDLQNGSGDFPSISVTEGSIVENTQIPTREGYQFKGWVPDPAVTPIIKNTTFVAQWQLIPEDETPGDETPNDGNTVNKNKVAFVFGDGETRYIEVGEDGYVKNIPEPEPKEGYRFLCWNPDPKKVKVKEDTVFYAVWEKLGSNDSGKTEIEYTRGTKNDGTQANIRIPNAGKSITIVLVILSISTLGIVFYIRYRKIDM